MSVLNKQKQLFVISFSYKFIFGENFISYLSYFNTFIYWIKVHHIYLFVWFKCDFVNFRVNYNLVR